MNNVSSTHVAQGTQVKRIWKFAKMGVVKGMEAIKLKFLYMIFYHHSKYLDMALALVCLYPLAINLHTYNTKSYSSYAKLMAKL